MPVRQGHGHGVDGICARARTKKRTQQYNPHTHTVRYLLNIKKFSVPIILLPSLHTVRDRSLQLQVFFGIVHDAVVLACRRHSGGWAAGRRFFGWRGCTSVQRVARRRHRRRRPPTATGDRDSFHCFQRTLVVFAATLRHRVFYSLVFFLCFSGRPTRTYVLPAFGVVLPVVLCRRPPPPPPPSRSTNAQVV